MEPIIRFSLISAAHCFPQKNEPGRYDSTGLCSLSRAVYFLAGFFDVCFFLLDLGFEDFDLVAIAPSLSMNLAKYMFAIANVNRHIWVPKKLRIRRSGQRDSNPCIGLGRPALYHLSYAR